MRRKSGDGGTFQRFMENTDANALGLSEAAKNVALGLRRGLLAPIWLVCLAICVDFPVITLAFWFVQYGSIPAALFSPLSAAFIAGLGAFLFVVMMVATGSYNSRVMAVPTAFIARTALALIFPAILVSAFQPVGDLNVVLTAGVITLALAVIPTRLGTGVAVNWVIDAGLIARRAVIAGGGEQAAKLIRGLGQRQGNDIRLHGIFDDRDDLRSPIQILGIPKIGGYDDLIFFVQASEIDMVIIALPLEAEARIKWLLEEFKILPVEVRLSAYSQDYAFAQPNRDPLLAGIRRSFAPERRLTKRAFDTFFASVAILLLWPVMLCAAIAVRLESPGPVIFRQRRHGYNNRIIEVLKFRSMYSEMSDPEAKQVVTRGDPRVTRVGRFLRRSSIDELPQLFNVLRGDLSLVGPRPHAVEALSSAQEKFTQIIDGYSARHRLPPGITGWAQINGWRGEIDDSSKLIARFEHDLYYIENWSFWFDLKILIRTPFSLFNTKAAY